jgi:hypothetical protein
MLDSCLTKSTRVLRAKIMDAHNSKERDRFREAYRRYAEENRVRPDRSPVYVNWGEGLRQFPAQEAFEKQVQRGY